jgi:hypothetical protein
VFTQFIALAAFLAIVQCRKSFAAFFLTKNVFLLLLCPKKSEFYAIVNIRKYLNALREFLQVVFI